MSKHTRTASVLDMAKVIAAAAKYTPLETRRTRRIDCGSGHHYGICPKCGRGHGYPIPVRPH